MTSSPSDHSARQPANASSPKSAAPAASRPLHAPAPAKARAPRRKLSHSKLIIPFLSAGLLVAGGAMLIREHINRPFTASMVMRDLRDLALQRGAHAGQPDGGALGPWWISAVSYDPMSGELKNFRLKSGSIELAALSAKILVDPEADSIGFDLYRLVYTVLPNDTNPEQVGELIEMKQYTLGPVPFGREIVPDSGIDLPSTPLPRHTPVAPQPPIASVTDTD